MLIIFGDLQNYEKLNRFISDAVEQQLMTEDIKAQLLDGYYPIIKLI